MVKRIRRIADCKTEVEKSLRALAYDTNPVDQNSLHDKECVVLYDNVSTEIYTQEEYEHKIYITIDVCIDNNNEIPYVALELIENITHDVENSAVPWCTSFQVTNSDVLKLGTSHILHITACYIPIVDWVVD